MGHGMIIMTATIRYLPYIANQLHNYRMAQNFTVIKFNGLPLNYLDIKLTDYNFSYTAQIYA